MNREEFLEHLDACDVKIVHTDDEFFDCYVEKDGETWGYTGIKCVGYAEPYERIREDTFDDPIRMTPVFGIVGFAPAIDDDDED